MICDDLPLGSQMRLNGKSPMEGSMLGLVHLCQFDLMGRAVSLWAHEIGDSRMH